MIYFDHAATGFPKSQNVIKTVCTAMEECGNPGRGSHSAAVTASEAIFGCREALGRMLGCPPERVVLTPNTSYALNMAIRGLLSSGRVIMSPLEHNSACRPLYALEREGKIKTEVFDMNISDDGQTVASVKKLCKRRACSAVITHASNVCGKILPVREIADAIHESGGIVILDAAQSAGHIDISFEATGADAICIAGHKGLGGPLGTGALAVSGKVAKKIKPFIYGGSGIASLEKGMPKVLPEMLEAGTLNAPAFAGLSAAVSELKKGSEDGIFAFLLTELKKLSGVTVYGNPDSVTEGYVPVILFNVEGMGSDAVAAYLASKGICVRSGWHCSPLAHNFLGSHGGVRISIGRSNTLGEAKELVCQLKALVPAR